MVTNALNLFDRTTHLKIHHLSYFISTLNHQETFNTAGPRDKRSFAHKRGL